ncbi:hypothetical protein BpHYR1_002120 [Brachionus plicatilis]|uniref:Uncharacterized protein n=1 Tax=Brachionus plicatilis TaxID=10195 RepID=A0A3M7PJI7_BRAPC|nr:hypothetical protein BpHYR1_002120 [Brachionus plicatilis]
MVVLDVFVYLGQMIVTVHGLGMSEEVLSSSLEPNKFFRFTLLSDLSWSNLENKLLKLLL